MALIEDQAGQRVAAVVAAGEVVEVGDGPRISLHCRRRQFENFASRRAMRKISVAVEVAGGVKNHAALGAKALDIPVELVQRSFGPRASIAARRKLEYGAVANVVAAVGRGSVQMVAAVNHNAAIRRRSVSVCAREVVNHIRLPGSADSRLNQLKREATIVSTRASGTVAGSTRTAGAVQISGLIHRQPANRKRRRSCESAKNRERPRSALRARRTQFIDLGLRFAVS